MSMHKYFRILFHCTLENGIDCIYDWLFQKADEIYNKGYRNYPGNYIMVFLKGIMTCWEKNPLTHKSSDHTSFAESMSICIKSSETLNDNSNESEYLSDDLQGSIP
jgi:hypothetical protein